MKTDDFLALIVRLVDLGYEKEIQWQREVKPCTNHQDFFCESCWVILNSGMKEQIARIIWDRIKKAFADRVDISTVFKHEGKVKAIKWLDANSIEAFKNYQLAEDKLAYLETIPFIGKITKYHLAKNLGHDVVKPDRHLVRIAEQYNTTPDELCERLASETGEKKCVVDIVIWRACNLKLI